MVFRSWGFHASPPGPIGVAIAPSGSASRQIVQIREILIPTGRPLVCFQILSVVNNGIATNQQVLDLI